MKRPPVRALVTAAALAAGVLLAGCNGEQLSPSSKANRPIPDKLVGPLCAATGSNLLRQYRDLQAALNEVCEVSRLADMLRAA